MSQDREFIIWTNEENAKLFHEAMKKEVNKYFGWDKGKLEYIKSLFDLNKPIRIGRLEVNNK